MCEIKRNERGVIMKAIMISIKPKWCAKIMNGEKTIEIRKNKALATAIQKLIDEYGYADIYVYCSKDGELFYNPSTKKWLATKSRNIKKVHRLSNGVVKFKFRCYKVEEIGMWNYSEYGTPTLMENSLCIYSCLNFLELRDYIKDKPAYAIHISDLEIFDEPKELSEFNHSGRTIDWCLFPLERAPQNFCYVEVSL